MFGFRKKETETENIEKLRKIQNSLILDIEEIKIKLDSLDFTIRDLRKKKWASYIREKEEKEEIENKKSPEEEKFDEATKKFRQFLA